MTRHTLTTSFSIGGDEPTWEGEVTLSYTVEWGTPESGNLGPPENYDPGSGDLIEDITVTHIDGKPATKDEAETMLAHIGEKLDDDLIAHAVEDDIGRHEDAAEARYQSRREDTGHWEVRCDD